MDLAAPLDAVDRALEAHFAQRPMRASVSFVGVDPIEVLRFEPVPGERAYLSLGMARRPMTASTADLLSTDGPRAELMLHLRDEPDEFADVWRRARARVADRDGRIERRPGRRPAARPGHLDRTRLVSGAR
jgi:hypothetical protein